MALNFQGGRIILGTEYASYQYEIYEPGTTTDKTTYKESSLSTQNTSPVVLDANGAAQIWFDGNADVILKDADGNEVYSDDDVNLGSSSTAAGAFNLILNPSFEDDTDGDGTPDSWTVTLYTGGAFTLDTTDQVNGQQNAKFTSTGTGGGYLTSTDFFAVTAGNVYAFSAWIKSSVADVRNNIDILWYQSDQTASATPSTSLYDDSTTNPLSWTEKFAQATAPADATYAKLRLTGCNSTDATAGNVKFDRVFFGLPRTRDLLTTTGDLIYASAANTPARLALGRDRSLLKAGATIPEYGTLPGYFNGFGTSNNGTDADHDIDIAAGECADSTGEVHISDTAGSTKQADADWAAGTAAGGMPATVAKTGTIAGAGTTITGTGTAFTTEFEVGDVLWSSTSGVGRRVTAIASDTSLTIESAFPADPAGATAQKNGLAPNTWYDIFVLVTAAGASVDYGFDTQPDAVNLLADATVAAASLTKYQYVMSFKTDASANILGYTQYQDTVAWDVPIVTFSGNAPTSKTEYAAGTPITRRTVANLHAVGQISLNGSTQMRIMCPDETDAAVSLANATLAYYSNDIGTVDAAVDVLTDASGQYSIRGAGAYNLNVNCKGYRVFRGQS